MTWEVEVSDEFLEWYQDLAADLRIAIATAVDRVEANGPELGRPFADTLKGSRFPNMKELRVQHRGRPYRILFIFDPRRNAYLILGGDKSVVGTIRQSARPMKSTPATWRRLESRERWHTNGETFAERFRPKQKPRFAGK